MYIKKEKIVLVEDDPDHAMLIMDILEMVDIDKEVVLLKDGQAAIDYLQKVDRQNNAGISSHIDMVLLDLNLPKVHGMDVLKFIKSNSNLCLIPVVILSTSDDSKTIEYSYKNGACGFIVKPFAYEDFVEKIKNLKQYN